MPLQSVSFSRNPVSLRKPQLNILVAPLAVPPYSLTNISHWLHSFLLEGIPALLTLTSVSFRGPLNSALGLVNTQRTETQCQQAAPPRKHYLNPNCLPSTFKKTSYCASYVLVKRKIGVQLSLFKFTEGHLLITSNPKNITPWSAKCLPHGKVQPNTTGCCQITTICEERQSLTYIWEIVKDYLHLGKKFMRGNFSFTRMIKHHYMESFHYPFCL